MSGAGIGGCSSRRLFGLVGVLVAGSLSATPGIAFDALNGRIQAHGFFESQLRVISEDYTDHWDVTQWYNIFNLEVEADIVRNTWGPIDLLSAYVRVEVRFDCIYSRGCGMFRSVNLYGDRAKSLPDRLNDATHGTRHGVITLPTVGLPEGAPDPYAEVARNPGRNPMPASQVSIFTALSTFPGVDGFDEENPCDLDDPGCDYLAGSGEDVVDERVRYVVDDPWPYIEESFSDYVYTAMNNGYGGEAWLGPWQPRNTIVPIGFLADRVNPFKEDQASPTLQAAVWNAGFLDVFDTSGDADAAAANAEADLDDLLLGRYKGALPFRPAPEKSYDDPSATLADARGIYYPPAGLRKAILRGDLDSFDFNFSESERAWNRGASQQQTKELKEAYFDLETLDSHLWLRIGLQHIIWGKTELFRTTDQFNPQDLALASLPSLEESRIALWAVRGVYSFYQVGGLDDVRVELAFNFDDFQPNDLGACGEPYTPNPVCSAATWGAFTHGVFAVGLAGTDQPPSPWESLEGWEIGGRVEFRYDRFSFAISDFWGFSDMSYTDLVSVYQRNMDPVTGLPRRAGVNGPGTDFDALSQGDLTDGVADPAHPDACWSGLEPACLTDEDALYKHHANQQLFSFICASTIGFSTLDPTACSLSIFNSQSPVMASFSTAQFVSLFLAGNPFLVSVLSSPAAGDFTTFGYPLDLVALNPDPGDYANPPDPPYPGDPDDCRDPLSGQDCGGDPSVPLLFAGLAATLTPEQEALLGCGPFWGTNCDDSGIDIMNSDASVLMQSWPGVEGTTYQDMNRYIRELVQPGVTPPTVGPDAWTTNYRVDVDGDGTLDTYLDQPGTQGWVVNRRGGPVGTTGDFAADGSNVQLPGSRAKWRDLPRTQLNLFGRDAYCAANPAAPGCAGLGGETDPRVDPRSWDTTRDGNPDGLLHPFTLQPWDNELAAFSWNLQALSAVLSSEFTEAVEANIASGDYPTNRLAYEAAVFDTENCSLVKPQLCSGVKGLLSIAGVMRNTVRAGGNETYGRRTFQWHSGGSALRRYDKRNVLGFAMDFAEDRSKMNFNIEAAWISKHHMADNDSPTGLSNVNTYNLTISVDRPTFIRFLNRNRTMFFNAQFFLQYIHGYKSSFPSNGPINFLFTASAATGYYQDRLVPSLTTVFDAKSRSGAVMAGLSYRFTQSFSASLNAALFYGRVQPVDMPLVEATAALNRPHYDVGYEGGLSVIRDRDEVSLRLRYTF